MISVLQLVTAVPIRLCDLVILLLITGSSICMIIAAAKLLQLCPILCDPIDGSPPDSPDPEILQARTLEWVAMSLSNACK